MSTYDDYRVNRQHEIALDFAKMSEGSYCQRCYDTALDVMKRDLGNNKLAQVLNEHDRGEHGDYVKVTGHSFSAHSRHEWCRVCKLTRQQHAS